MNRNTKIALWVVGALVLLCTCACGLFFVAAQYFGTSIAQSVVTEPEEVAALGEKIADFDLPEGYTDTFGMSFVIFDMVGMGPPDSTPGEVILLMQFSEWMNIDQASMQQQMQQSIEQQTDRRNVDYQIIEQKTVTIRDQEVILTTQEGNEAGGETVRQMFGFFEGRGGPVMLMIMGNAKNWNETRVDRFIDSIR